MAVVLLSTREFSSLIEAENIDSMTTSMHPLETFSQWRRRWFGWLPIHQRWERSAEDVAPERHDDWLLDPINQQEASALFPHLSKERAILQYQKIRLQMREQEQRGY